MALILTMMSLRTQNNWSSFPYVSTSWALYFSMGEQEYILLLGNRRLVDSENME